MLDQAAEGRAGSQSRSPSTGGKSGITNEKRAQYTITEVGNRQSASSDEMMGVGSDAQVVWVVE